MLVVGRVEFVDLGLNVWGRDIGSDDDNGIVEV